MSVSLPELGDILGEEYDDVNMSELLARLEAALGDAEEYVTQDEDSFQADRETSYEELMERVKRYLDALADTINLSKETVLELAREISEDI